MTETQAEITRFNVLLNEASNIQHTLRSELVSLNAQVAETTRQRDEFAQRISVLEGVVSGLVLREPESIVRALQKLLIDDAPAIADAVRGLVRVAVANDDHDSAQAIARWLPVRR